MSARVVLGLGLAAMAFMAGCGGAIDASSTDETTGAWSAMLTCGEGGAVLEVDRADARRLQLVVRDDAATREIATHVARATNLQGEVIVRGSARLPVDGAGAFDQFVDESGRFEKPAGSVRLNDVGGPETRVVAEVRRAAADRLNLAFREVTVSRVCTGNVEERHCRGGEWVESRRLRTLATWAFEGCR